MRLEDHQNFDKAIERYASSSRHTLGVQPASLRLYLSPNSLEYAQQGHDMIVELIAAIESGEYHKGKGGLRFHSKNSDDEYCCIGVFCDLRVKENPGVFKWGYRDLDLESGQDKNYFEEENQSLPLSNIPASIFTGEHWDEHNSNWMPTCFNGTFLRDMQFWLGQVNDVTKTWEAGILPYLRLLRSTLSLLLDSQEEPSTKAEEEET